MRQWGDEEEQPSILHRIEQGVFGALVAVSFAVVLVSLFRLA